MTGRLIADSEHMDHVTILLARVCAARLDATIKAEDFVRMVARLVDVAVAEALEDREAADADLIEGLKRGLRLCPYCHIEVASMVGHECERMRELGFVDAPQPRVNAQPLDDSLSIADNVKRREQSAAPAAGHLRAAPSQEGAGAATGAADSERCDECEGEHGHLKHDCPNARADADSPTTTKEDGSASGAARCLPQATAAAPISKNGRRMTAEQSDTLRAAYEQVMRDNDGVLPFGWLSKQARALGFTQQSVSDRVKAWAREPRVELRDAAPREHGNSHACWCRKAPNSSANRWCSNATPSKSPGTLAGLQETRPRRERELREVDA